MTARHACPCGDCCLAGAPDQIARMVHDVSGIVIGPDKGDILRARFQRRARLLGLKTLADYFDLIAGASAERDRVISLLTTNVTGFFREAHHFDLLARQIMPGLHRIGRRINIWSAGCSSGPEPWSIAMTLHEHCAEMARRTRILACDIDAAVLHKAQSGCYGADEVTGLSAAQINRHFCACGDGPLRRWRLASPLREMAEFRQLNLHDAWPGLPAFDVIFFRNVSIYFDPPAQRRLWQRFHDQLRPGGWLLIGHAERVPGDLQHLLRPAGLTAYRRPDPNCEAVP